MLHGAHVTEYEMDFRLTQNTLSVFFLFLPMQANAKDGGKPKKKRKGKKKRTPVALGLFSDSTLEMEYLSLFPLGNFRKKKKRKKEKSLGKKKEKTFV